MSLRRTSGEVRGRRDVCARDVGRNATDVGNMVLDVAASRNANGARNFAGHYGVVRKGVRRSDGARVAVKTIPKRRAVYIEMLRGEVSLLESLDHPNIIKLYDAFEDEKQVHLVSELCEGGELFEPIADTSFRFSERQASRLVRRMLYAIKACHDKGIAHRDLKPENVSGEGGDGGRRVGVTGRVGSSPHRLTSRLVCACPALADAADLSGDRFGAEGGGGMGQQPGHWHTAPGRGKGAACPHPPIPPHSHSARRAGAGRLSTLDWRRWWDRMRC
jgi:hypothetical protein